MNSLSAGQPGLRGPLYVSCLHWPWPFLSLGYDPLEVIFFLQQFPLPVCLPDHMPDEVLAVILSYPPFPWLKVAFLSVQGYLLAKKIRKFK